MGGSILPSDAAYHDTMTCFFSLPDHRTRLNLDMLFTGTISKKTGVSSVYNQ